MKNKRKVTLTVVAILTIVLTVVGVTYAYWTLTRKQTDMNELVAACLDFQLTNAVEGKTAINLANAEPISVNEAYENDENNYSFKVVNNCNDKINYFVALENLTPAANQISGESLVVSLDNKIYSVYNDLENTTPVDGNATDAKLLRYDSIDGRSEKTYSLGMFINKTSGLEDTGKSFSSKIFVTGGQLNTPKSKLTDDECFTIDANGTITDYDESCGKSVVIPATINDIKVKRVARDAFKKTQFSCGGGMGFKTKMFVSDSGRDVTLMFETPANDTIKHTLEKALQLGLNVELYPEYPTLITPTETGFKVEAWNVSGPNSDIIVKNPKFSFVEFSGTKYFASDSMANAKYADEYIRRITGISNAKAFIYEDSYSYLDFASSFWINSDYSSSYFVSDDMTFEQFKTAVAPFDLSGYTPTTITKAQASTYLTNEYSPMLELKPNDGIIYQGAYQFVNPSFAGEAGATKRSTTVDYVDSETFASYDNYDIYMPYIYTSSNMESKLQSGQVNEEDIIEIYEKNGGNDEYIAVTNDNNLVSPIYSSLGFIDVVYEGDFTSAMKKQYTKVSDGMLIYDDVDDNFCSDASKLLIDELDISNAVFLEKVENFAFSNLYQAPKDVVQEVTDEENLEYSIPNKSYQGLKALKMPRLAENVILGYGAFSGSALTDLTYYNNSSELLQHALETADVDEYNSATASHSMCDGDKYYCPYGAFSVSSIENLTFKDATGSKSVGNIFVIKHEGEYYNTYLNNVLINQDTRASSSLFLSLLSLVTMPFYDGKIDNVLYDDSIEIVGSSIMSSIKSSIVLPSSLKEWHAISTSFMGDNAKVILNKPLTDFKNNVQIYGAGLLVDFDELGLDSSQYAES